MKIKSKNLLIGFLMMFLMIFSALGMNPIKVNASGSVRVDFCLTNGALENNVFFENDSSKYFMSHQTQADGTLYYLEELYRTDNLNLEFDGWYTEEDEKVTLETVFTEYTIIYDRWKETTLTDEDIISTLEIDTPLLEVGENAEIYDVNSITLTDDRLTVESVSVYEGLNAYRTNKLNDSDVLEVGKSYSIRVELHTKNGELIDDQLMSNSTATYGLVANMVYSHDNSGIFTTQWTNKENKIQVIINYDFENYYFTYDLEDKVVENGQSPQYTVYVSNNANVQCMELFVENANATWASLGAINGQFNIPANNNIVKQYRVEVTYQNGFVISSNTFKVDWYDPNAPKFITQPTDYDVAYGTNVLVTWALNCDVSAIYLEKFNGETYSQYQNATPTGATINAFAESGTYTFRVHAIKDGNDYYSDDFTITWREKFVFTTQPQSQSVGAGLGEDIIITWDMDIGDISLLQIFKIETYDTSEGWRHSVGLTSDTKSYTFSASNFAYAQKYRLMANYDGTLYYSDEFTIEFIAGEFTKQPDSEINAIVGKDCLVEWDFNLDVEYYDIKVYESNDFVPFATTDKPEYNFTASEVGEKQFFIQAYNANDQIIGEDYLMFRINWTEQQIVYLVSFNNNGGTGTMQSFEKNAGNQYVLPNCAYTAPEGYVFKAWDVNGVEKQPSDTITINSNTIIKAIWEDLPTFIVAYGPGNGNGSTDFDYIVEGTEVTLLNPAELDFTPLEGMQFAHWKVCKDNASDPNAVIKQPGDTITITFETYIIAVWEEIPTFELVYGPGDGNGSNDLDHVLPGTEITLPTPAEVGFTPLEGMQFSHWKVCKDNAQDPNAVIKQPGDTITITYNTYIIAVWTEKAHECEGVKQDGQIATCETAGWKDYYKCSCNKIYSDEACTNEITDFEAWKLAEGKTTKDHEYGQLVEKVPATHTQTELLAGMEAHYYCVECETYFDENKKATTQQELVIPKPEHQYGAFITSDSEEHYKQCSCGLRSEVGNHVYTDEEDAECNTCGHNRTIVHECEGVKQDGQIATCTTDGWKDYYKCSCNKLYSDEACTNEITDFEAWKLAEGKTTKDHEYGELIAKVDSSCNATGKKAHYECSVCHALFDENKVVRTEKELTIGIDENAHKYSEWTSNGDGTHSRVCSENQEHKETENCSGGSATCTAKAVCSVCNAVYGELLDHAHSSEYKSDANEHWNECDCGDKANKASHVDSNKDGKCDVCDYQMSEQIPTPQPKDGLSGGVIAIIVSGSVLVLGVSGFALVWFVIKKKKFSDLIALFKK